MFVFVFNNIIFFSAQFPNQRHFICSNYYNGGTGQFACDHIFDHVAWIPSTALYVAKWGGVKETVGIVDGLGSVIFPNFLTKVGPVSKGVIPIEKDDKIGLVSDTGYDIVMPKYDSWCIDKNQYVLFKKGRYVGYVSTSTGIFVPKSLFNRRDYIGLDDFFMVDFL